MQRTPTASLERTVADRRAARLVIGTYEFDDGDDGDGHQHERCDGLPVALDHTIHLRQEPLEPLRSVYMRG